LNEIPSDDTPADPVEPSLLKKIDGHKILEIKTNHIPRVLVPLERLLERTDTTVSPEKQTHQAAVSEFNIDTEKEPKFVKLSKSLSNEERKIYLDLMKEFKYIFSWSYEELRTFHTNVMQHKIPLKEGVKPFQQKLRQINPMLYPIIVKELKWMLDAKIIVPLRYSKCIANMLPI